MDLLKKATNPVINTLVGLYLAVLFFTPYITVNEENLTALQAFLKYGSVHWTYNYFLVALTTPILAYIFLIFKKKFKNDLFEYGALLVWILALIGQFVIIDRSPSTSLDDPLSLGGFWTSFITLLIVLYHVLSVSISRSVKKAKKTENKMEDLKVGKKVLYENVVLLNPFIFYFIHLYFSKPLPFIATDKEFIIGGDEPITIPFSEIREIKLHHSDWGTWLLGLLTYITIELSQGKSYRISWGSHISLAWSGYLNAFHTNKLTKQLFDDIKEVFEKREKVSDTKWRDFYEKHRKI